MFRKLIETLTETKIGPHSYEQEDFLVDMIVALSVACLVMGISGLI